MIFDEIVARTRERVATLPAPGMADGFPAGSVRSLRGAILRKRQKNAIIAEIKYASPSAGNIRAFEDPGRLAAMLTRGGAAALSVLTEPYFFKGDPANIGLVKLASDLPVLRKDFIIDQRQIYESRLLGADAVLLIAGLLGDRLLSFVEECHRFALEPLVEVHSADEVPLALASGTGLIGINNRDLTTMETCLKTTRVIAETIRREHVTIVSESGIFWPCDIRYLSRYCDAYLIGSSLMRSTDPEKALEGLACA
ncbi:MAG TPA: indole-3-glycerol-phosphate synthase [Methanoregulaceae archaeon]|nr:indole-3-glycerol-phosphate synthase [Methanoregulaceae archaeon]